MAEEFKFNGGDSKSIREAFLDRKTYKESASLQDVQMLDTWYQYPNYGLLDHNYRPVVVAEGSGEENLREIVAFPMNQQAEDLMMGSPNIVNENQLPYAMNPAKTTIRPIMV